jgi:hypothetical protein
MFIENQSVSFPKKKLSPSEKTLSPLRYSFTPLSTAFLPPKPGRCSTEKPAAIRPRLTAPATVYVAQAPPVSVFSPIAKRSSGRHIEGFFFGP